MPINQIMRKQLLSLFLVLQSFVLFAQIPSGYYSTATGLSGTSLRQALHDIIDNHSVKSYSSLYGYYQTTDVKPNGKVWDMYSDIPNGTPPYTFTFSQTCGNYSNEGDCFNREHSWPQSWFNSNSPMVSDLFHVYPTDGKVNGIRSNYPYGEVGTATTTTLNGSKLGACSFPGYTGIVFEPIAEYKGDFARTYFYMCTRYYTEDSGWLTNDMIIGANLKPWALELMKKWNQQDPVSAKEIARNNAVYTIQGNRNPFIDHPEYACMIWPGGNFCSIIPSITNITKTPAAPIFSDSVAIIASITDDGSIAGANLKWGTSLSAINQTISMHLTSTANVYQTNSKIPPQADGTTVYYFINATDNQSNISTSATGNYYIGIPTSPAPIISSITKNPNNVNTTNAVTISCAITDDGSVAHAELLWGYSSTAMNTSISMTNTSNSIYISSTSIPAQTLGTTIYFKINATDNLGQTSSSNMQSYIVSAANTNTCATDLIISEYVEGSSNNKYIELYNGTTNSINLSNYKLKLYANGSSTATQDVTLSGTIPANGTAVFKNSAATLYTGTASNCNATNFNGNDAISLVKISPDSVIDIIGRIGENPGTAWTSGTLSLLDQTLVRKATVISGVSSNPLAGFPTLATEWDGFAKDDISNLGGHTMTCGSASNSIQTTLANNTGFCLGAIINVNYLVNGSINTNNVYSIQLSDANGDFSNSTTIGSTSSNTILGNITGIIPNNLIAGNGYKVRVNASDPLTTGESNATAFSIHALPSVSAGADVRICNGQYATLQASGASIYSWDNGAGDSSLAIVAPNKTTTYEVIGIDANGCSNFDSVTVFVDTIATPMIEYTVLSNMHVGLISNYVDGNQWYQIDRFTSAVNMLANENGQNIDIEKWQNFVYDYYTIVTNAQGCVSDSSNHILGAWMGINNFKAQALSIFPNPNEGRFQIDCKNKIGENASVKVYNNLGQLVFQKQIKIESAFLPLDLSLLSKGIYAIELISEKSLSSGKVMIK